MKDFIFILLLSLFTALDAYPEQNTTIIAEETRIGSLIRSFGYQSCATGKYCAFEDIALSSDGVIAGGTSSGTVTLYSASTGAKIRDLFPSIGRPIAAVAFSKDGKTLFVGTNETVSVWNLQTNKIVRTFSNRYVWNFSVSSDNKLLVVASWDCVKVWNLVSGTITWTLRFTGSINIWDAAINKESTLIVSVENLFYRLTLFDVTTGKLLRFWGGHQSYITTVAFSEDSRYIASGSSDTYIKIWDVATGKMVRLLKGHTKMVKDVLFTKDGKYLISTSLEELNGVKIWNLSTGEEIITANKDIRIWDARINGIPSGPTMSIKPTTTSKTTMKSTTTLAATAKSTTSTLKSTTKSTSASNLTTRTTPKTTAKFTSTSKTVTTTKI
ncbi:hypothetical protein HK098_003495 [Nowakowskiella sp. JEL0407]|nr:hypothetical protein HK098_003495 [Nowakowskiella sp. JEL0407]